MKQRRREYPSRRFPERRGNVRYPDFQGVPPERKKRPASDPLDLEKALRWIIGLGVSAIGAALLIAVLIAHA